MFKSYPFLPIFGRVCFEAVSPVDLQCADGLNETKLLT